MSTNIKKLILSAVLLLCVFQSKANHLIGGDLTYTCQGDKKYIFTLTLYGECGVFEKNVQPFYQLQYYSESNGIFSINPNQTVLNLFSSEEVTKLCAGQVSKCQDDQSDVRGINKYTFTSGVIDLSAYDYANDWIFYTIPGARSNEILTLEDNENTIYDFYMEAYLNNLDAPCNNSPQLNGDPIVTACVGKEINYNPQAIESDGDDLVYSLETPRSSASNTVKFENGFSAINAISTNNPLEINSTSGDVLFNADFNNIGITDIQVEEYNNDGVLIGRVTSAIQIESYTCTSEPPEFEIETGFSDSNSICANSNIAFSITGSDSDVGQLLTAEKILGNKGTFAISGQNTTTPVVNFSWTPTDADTGTYTFTLELTDNACPEAVSSTKSIIIEVLPSPIINIGAGITNDATDIPCDSTVTIKPIIAEGTEPYTITWTDFSTGEILSTDDSVIVEGPTNLQVTVTDQNGCTTTSNNSAGSAGGTGGLVADFEASPFCLGNPTDFVDNSSSALGNITDYKWILGDNNVMATSADTSYTYPKDTSYEVTLIVEDDRACIDTVTKVITICAPVEVGFIRTDSCEINDVAFVDTTDYGDNCDVSKRYWDFGTGDDITYEVSLPSVPTIPSSTGYSYAEKGDYTVTFISENSAGCIDTVVHEFTFYDKPEITFLQSTFFYLNCNDPDTVLTAEVDSGHPGYTYLWSTSSTDSFTLANEADIYNLRVEDTYGCYDNKAITISFPVAANFGYDPVCTEGDSMQLYSKTFSATSEPASWLWDFGDGGSSTKENPKHKYSTRDDFLVKLTVRDSTGCESVDSSLVYHKFLENNFDIKPDDISVCATDLVYGIGFSEDPVNGSHLDTITWNFGNSEMHEFYDPTFFTGTDWKGPVTEGDSTAWQYATDGDYTISTTVVFNRHPERHDSSCVRTSSEDIEIFPEFKVDLDVFRVCIDDTASFSFERTTGDPDIELDTIIWTLTNFGESTPFHTENVDSFTYIFNTQADYIVNLELEDEFGCMFDTAQTLSSERLATPNFITDHVCANENTFFEVPTVFVDTFENITNYTWYFGNGDSLNGFWPLPQVPISYKYEVGGTYDVELYLYNVVSNCRSSVTKEVDVKDIPIAEFSFDTVCIGDKVTFVNNTTTTALSGEITGYSWDFGDGSTSSSENPTHEYSSEGTYEVTLVAYTNDCGDTIKKTVSIIESPTAEFEILTPLEEFEAGSPIDFNDLSSFTTSPINTYLWDFGDGGFIINDQTPSYTYTDVNNWTVTLKVTNILGCSDSYSKNIDLNTYLDLPTAFSPNGDGVNDQLNLIKKLVVEIYEFKIYNRWGELIFDGGTDINAFWDGTYKGVIQENGTYVAYVKGLGFYNKEFNFKKNVTLLR